MTPHSILPLFRNKRDMAAAFGISPASITYWFRNGRVPALRQYQLPEILMRRASSDPRQTGGPAVPAGQESSQDAPDLTQPTNTR